MQKTKQKIKDSCDEKFLKFEMKFDELLWWVCIYFSLPIFNLRMLKEEPSSRFYNFIFVFVK